MPDIIDDANDLAARCLDAALSHACAAARAIPTGAPGVCDECGEWHPRLGGGVCAGCREEMGE